MSDVLFIIDIQFVAAGLLGGLFHAFSAEKPSPWEVVRSIVLGGIAGNFFTKGIIVLGTLASGVISTRVLEIVVLLPPGVIAFLIGMSGKKISIAIDAATNHLLGKTENE